MALRELDPSRTPESRIRWIVSNAQRAVDGSTNEFNATALIELVHADEWCGHHDVHSGYRLLIKNRILELKSKRDRKERRSEARLMLVLSFISSLVVALFAVGADRYLASLSQ